VSLDLWEDLLVKVSYARFFVPNQVHNQCKKDGSTGRGGGGGGGGGGEDIFQEMRNCRNNG
jgi:hypothetical protein